ncbi:hypothetical protein MJ904_20695 [Massilia sp. MB5]|uniref:hypothetical protein n=1 Tax=unclassified Massilia TaxID=2609279 RepID=UPI000A9C0118|nr:MULTISPECIES: hypothetical protein [unclassified Massilia]UMR29458.1 hypothetical protein MJ904_20695 [Massilia sp. MB5]
MNMNPKLLSNEEYRETLYPNMVNVTENAEEVVDLWAYADQVIEDAYHSCTAWEWRVGHIYETPDAKYQHIGIPVPKDDTYLVVIANKQERNVVGHYILELRA